MQISSICYCNLSINKFKKKYNFKVLDYKECNKISNTREYYFDSEHLNYYGANMFTNMLINDINSNLY